MSVYSNISNMSNCLLGKSGFYMTKGRSKACMNLKICFFKHCYAVNIFVLSVALKERSSLEECRHQKFLQ